MGFANANANANADADADADANADIIYKKLQKKQLNITKFRKLLTINYKFKALGTAKLLQQNKIITTNIWKHNYK